MSNQPNMIQSNAMPQQVLTTMPPGSKGPMDAGVKMQQQQTNDQMALIGKSGGSRRNRGLRLRGGATPVVQVPPVTAGSANAQLTGDNYKDLTALAQQQQTQAVYDSAKNPGDTAAKQAQQEAIYKGGNKKGGSWPKWGCLSGGKKSRKNCKCKRRKTKKSRKNRKSRKFNRH